MMIDEVYRKALLIYGIEKQRIKAIEELSELQKELCKSALGADNRTAIADEIADVCIMVDQMIYAYGLDDEVRRHIKYKTDRLNDRITSAGFSANQADDSAGRKSSAEDMESADNQKPAIRPYFKSVPIPNKTELAVGDAAQKQKTQRNPNTSDGYSGFLFLRCPHCGHDRGFFTRERLKVSRCKNCGESSDLKKLVRMEVLCKCGKNISYRTNIADVDTLSINCFACGSPIDLEWNRKRNQFETM